MNPPTKIGDDQRRGLWRTLIGWSVDNPLVIFLLTAMVVGGGIYVAPFSLDGDSLPRDPVPVDAIPDVGENQQIVFTQWPGYSPRDVEDQITYPLTTVLLGIPGVRTVRSTSALGYSTIYVIFEDDVEFYWSRSRLLEKLASLSPETLPGGVTPTLGPDATALGQIFGYTLEGQDAAGRTVGGWDPDELRSIQDWTVRYALQSVRGVSEVASVGGFVREYQVDVDPQAMRAHNVSIAQVAEAVGKSNLDVGARTLEVNRVEYIVRGRGLVTDLEDLEATVVVARGHTPIRIRDVGRVSLGPAPRRGALDDEGAPAVGGIVVARYRENPLAVIAAVKDKIAQLQPGLPSKTLEDGTVSTITIVPFYDRTTLINETLGTLSTTLYRQILITIIVVLIMLRNLRSSMLLSLMLPFSVLIAFIAMKLSGVDANIMALGGIAIAVGTMVDIGIVFIENINRHLDDAPANAPRASTIRGAAAEVAPAMMTSVLTTVVGFLPVFGLSSRELRLFAPLAFTKTFTMMSALSLALLVLPAAALFVFRRHPDRPSTETTGLREVARSLLRTAHIRDWVIVALSFVLLRYSLVAGLLTMALGAYRLARPFMTSRLNQRMTVLENVVAVVAVTLLLAEDWLPLGRSEGLLINTLIVGVLIASVMGMFRLFESVYPRVLSKLLRHKATFLLVPTSLVLFGIVAWLGLDTVFSLVPPSVRTSRPVSVMAQAFPGLGREYMPPFDEGSYLYMPTTMPHASIGEGLRMMSEIDAAIAEIPEVDRVVGKLGRADSALDPAPLSMIETVVTYLPEFRLGEDGEHIRQWRDHIRTPNDIWDEIVRAAELPGLTSAAKLMPINARIVMLQSGMRAPMGIKVHGPSLQAIEDFSRGLEQALKSIPAVRPETVIANRVQAKPYLEINVDRESIGRYGLTVVDVQNVLQLAVGGMTVTRAFQGRERYPVRIRYMREERDHLEALEQVFVPTPGGEQIPLTQVADIQYVRGPPAITSEDAFLTNHVLFDRQPSVSEVEVVERAERVIRDAIASGELTVPTGVSFEFSGTYENQIQTEKRLMVLVPVALVLVFILIYLQFRSVLTSIVISAGVIVAVSGGFAFLWLYGQTWFLDFELLGTPMRELFHVGTVNLSVAVWVGFIALVGIAADDGVLIATYLKQRFEQEPARSVEDARQRTLEAGLRRVRPCLMTTATTILALLPVITSQGLGSDIMVPMALPSIGGMTIELMTLFVVPVLYCALEERKIRKTPALMEGDLRR